MSPLIDLITGAKAYGWGSSIPADPGWSSIATINGSGNPSAITFNSIPQNYTDLQIRAVMKCSSATALTHNLLMRINANAGSNYTYSVLRANSTSVSATGATNSTYIYFPNCVSTSSTSSFWYSPIVIDFLDYASNKKTTAHAMYSADFNNSSTSFTIGQNSAIWSNTSPINSISFIPGDGVWSTNTVFALYGLKASL